MILLIEFKFIKYFSIFNLTTLIFETKVFGGLKGFLYFFSVGIIKSFCISLSFNSIPQIDQLEAQ